MALGLSEIGQGVQPGHTVISFGVADVAALRKTYEDAGVLFDGPTLEIPRVSKMASFKDPDGNRLVLYQRLGNS
jgi:predicted enzyme related to lactoylglutathione lyase